MKSQVLLLGVLEVVFVAGCATTGEVISDEPDETPYAECDSCCPEEKALLHMFLDSWGRFLERDDQFHFATVTYNYGFKEAKNVKIECEVYNDEDDEYPSFVVDDDIGNVASSSLKEREFVFTIGYIFVDDDAVAKCRITSCEDCEILTERIPELDD